LWRVFEGIRSRIKRRNFGVPILTSGVKYIWKNVILKATVLKICLVREISNVQSTVHKFLDRFGKDMIAFILCQRVEGVTKTTLANELEGSPIHP
jgi:GTP cyclohydrolase I